MNDVTPEVLQSPIHNRFVEPLLSGELAIDLEFAINAYCTYLQEVALLRAGIPFSALGMSERRELQLPELFTLGPGGPAPVVLDKWRLYYADETPANSVAVLKLSGVMRSESAASTRGIDVLERDLRQAYANPNILGVVLDVNSGGGEATAGWRLRSVVGERNKPVIANVHYAGSAAYLGITGATEIIGAYGGARFGSIGALYSIDKRLLAEHAENFLDVYADNSPNKNEEIRAALLGDLSPLRKMTTKVATEFRGAVKMARPLLGEPETIEETLSGRMFDAREATKRGLSDMTGNLNTAVSRVSLWASRGGKN